MRARSAGIISISRAQARKNSSASPMGHRYGCFMLGLVAAMWLVRNAPNTRARRALMIGAWVALTLTTAVSLYGALALGLNAWPAVATESVLLAGFVWVLFVKPEPVMDAA